MRYQFLSHTSYYKTITPGLMGRGTNDGISHPSHLYALKYATPGWSLLDVGCGSGTTYQAIQEAKLDFPYKGIDADNDYIAWCKKTFLESDWDVQDAVCLKEEEKSWDIVFCRGTIENLPSLAIALREWTRVARHLIIVWFWNGLVDGDKHRIQRLIYNNTLYPEYANKYAKVAIETDVMEFPDWKILELNSITPPGVPFGYHVLVLGNI